jgi:hypothetical protein
MKTIALALMTAAVWIGFGQPAGAQSKTFPSKYYVTVKGHLAPVTGAPEASMTFSHEVQIPGATLPAGTYLFSLVTPTTMRVTTEDGRKVFATFYTTSVTRTENTNHAQVRFERMPAGGTRLIAVYPDGSSTGFAPMFRKSSKEAGAPIATTGVK